MILVDECIEQDKKTMGEASETNVVQNGRLITDSARYIVEKLRDRDAGFPNINSLDAVGSELFENQPQAERASKH